MADEYNHLVKLLLIGDSGVGKSCLLLRFTEDTFTPSFITTIGIDFKIRTVDIANDKVKLQIWYIDTYAQDTAGQERFRTITTAYYRGAMGILLVYDVTDEKSFINIRNWIKSIEQHASENVQKMLLGNKCDLDHKKVIDTEKGQALADEMGIQFFETSAKDSVNVEEAFLKIAKDIHKKITSPEGQDADATATIKIDSDAKPNGGKKKKKCC